MDNSRNWNQIKYNIKIFDAALSGIFSLLKPRSSCFMAVAIMTSANLLCWCSWEIPFHNSTLSKAFNVILRFGCQLLERLLAFWKTTEYYDRNWNGLVWASSKKLVQNIFCVSGYIHFSFHQKLDWDSSNLYRCVLVVCCQRFVWYSFSWKFCNY